MFFQLGIKCVVDIGRSGEAVGQRKGRALLFRIIRAFAPGRKAMEPLFGLPVVHGILMVHVETVGTAVYLGNAVREEFEYLLIDAASV
jgi:hypothetical protein